MLPDHRLDTMASLTRWPHYAHAATGLGLRRVAAVPLRLREQVIGALSLFHNQPGGLSLPQLRLAQALADTAAIGILQQRSTADQALLATQLEHALQARIVIEQAKGALATHHAIDTDTAFELMRAHARTHQQRLTDLARQILEGTANRSLFDPAR
jgi:GAF domain-containing protein